MKSIIILITALLLSCDAFSQDIIFDWKHIISNTNQYLEGICTKTDSSGYVYVGGNIKGPLNFIDTSLTATQGIYNGFLTKLTPEGDMIWFKLFSSASFSRILSICFDKQNYFYIYGTYCNRVSFDDTTLITNNSDTIYSSNMFIAKYNTSGVLIWVRNTSGTTYEYGENVNHNHISIDTANNVIITGKCIEEIQYFDTTIAITTIDWEPIFHYYYHKSVGFLAKYTSDGQKLWVKEIGGEPSAIKTDHFNNILVTGGYWYNIYFDTIQLTPLGMNSFYLVKYNSDGHVVWASKGGGNNVENYCYDVAIDSVNNIYITGCMAGSNIVFGDSVFYTGALTDAYLAKYNNIGDVLWVFPIGMSHFTIESTQNSGTSIIIDDNNIFLLGNFKDTITFGNITLKGYGALFIIKTDLNGNVLKVVQYTEQQKWIHPSEITLSKNKIYLAGIMSSSGNYYDILIGKISDSLPVGIVFYDYTKNDFIVYPNPCQDKLFIIKNKNEIFDMEVFDITGKTINKSIIRNATNYYDVSMLKKGIYFLKFSNDKTIKTEKIIIY